MKKKVTISAEEYAQLIRESEKLELVRKCLSQKNVTIQNIRLIAGVADPETWDSLIFPILGND